MAWLPNRAKWACPVSIQSWTLRVLYVLFECYLIFCKCFQLSALFFISSEWKKKGFERECFFKIESNWDNPEVGREYRSLSGSPYTRRGGKNKGDLRIMKDLWWKAEGWEWGAAPGSLLHFISKVSISSVTHMGVRHTLSHTQVD